MQHTKPTDLQNAKAEFLQEHLAEVLRNRTLAEQELVKFKILREGFNVAKGVLAQQLGQVRAQPQPQSLTIIGFEGALERLTLLMGQTDMAIAKNEGSLAAFQAMEQQLTQQVQETVGSSASGVVEMIETEAGDSQILSVEELISSADPKGVKPATTPMGATKKKTSPKRGKGRQKAK